MKSANGTLISTAYAMKDKSGQSRPATGGKGNSVDPTAKVRGVVFSAIKGPHYSVKR